MLCVMKVDASGCKVQYLTVEKCIIYNMKPSTTYCWFSRCLSSFYSTIFVYCLLFLCSRDRNTGGILSAHVFVRMCLCLYLCQQTFTSPIVFDPLKKSIHILVSVLLGPNTDRWHQPLCDLDPLTRYDLTRDMVICTFCWIL